MSIANWNPDLTISPGTSKASLDGYLTTPFAGGVASGGTAPTSPVAGYTAWYDGQDLVNGFQATGAAINTWSDKSGNVNTAISQGTKPVLVTDGSGIRWASAFSTTVYFQLTTPISFILSQGCSIFAVVRPTSNSASFSTVFGTYAGAGGRTSVQLGATNTGLVEMITQILGSSAKTVDTLTASPLNTPSVWDGYHDPAIPELGVQRSTEAVQTAAGGTGGVASASNSDIGVWPNDTNQFLTGWIAELIYYSEPLTAAQRLLNRQYLNAKYNISA